MRNNEYIDPAIFLLKTFQGIDLNVENDTSFH